MSVNDIQGGYEYPEVVHFEIEEQDLSSYLRAADFLNISNVPLKAILTWAVPCDSCAASRSAIARPLLATRTAASRQAPSDDQPPVLAQSHFSKARRNDEQARRLGALLNALQLIA